MEMENNHIQEKAYEYIKHIKWLCRTIEKNADEMGEHHPQLHSLEFWEQEMQFLSYTINSAAHDMYEITADLIEELDADLEMKYQEKKAKKERRETEIIKMMEKARARAEAIAAKEAAGAEEGQAEGLTAEEAWEKWLRKNHLPNANTCAMLAELAEVKKRYKQKEEQAAEEAAEKEATAKEPAGAEEGPAAEEPEEAAEAAEPEAPTAASDPPSNIDEKELQAAGQQ